MGYSPAPRSSAQAAVHRGFMYVLGGEVSTSALSTLFVTAHHVFIRGRFLPHAWRSVLLAMMQCGRLTSLQQSLCRTLYKWFAMGSDSRANWQLSYLRLYPTRCPQVSLACYSVCSTTLCPSRCLCMRRSGGGTGVFAIRFELQASSGSVAAGPRHLRLGDPHR